METEITVEVYNTLDQAMQILKSNGFNHIQTFMLNDYYYSKYTINHLKKLNYKSLIKNSFLVREFTEDITKYQLCYKNKVFNKNNEAILEEKIKATIDNSQNTIEIFNKAGLTNWAKIKTTVYVFKYNNSEVLLQDVENLGIYLEIEEDQTISNLPLKQKREKLIEILKSTKLNTGSDYSIKKAYLYLHKNK